MEQLNFHNKKNNILNFPLIVIGEELRTPQNVGMGIRISEAFGVKKFYLNNNSPNTENRIVKRTARNTNKNINIAYYDDILSLISILKKEGYSILSLEITNRSKNIQDYNFTKHQKIALLIGSERFGIDPKALDCCEQSIHIPMFGKNASMNVINSLSVGLYEITKQITKQSH